MKHINSYKSVNVGLNFCPISFSINAMKSDGHGTEEVFFDIFFHFIMILL
jgi:hypothetical protein